MIVGRLFPNLLSLSPFSLNLDSPQEKSVKPNEMTFAGLMNAHANAGNLDSALEVFQMIKNRIFLLFSSFLFSFPFFFLALTFIPHTLADTQMASSLTCGTTVSW